MLRERLNSSNGPARIHGIEDSSLRMGREAAAAAPTLCVRVQLPGDSGHRLGPPNVSWASDFLRYAWIRRMRCRMGSGRTSVGLAVFFLKITRECKHCGASLVGRALDGTLRFSSMERSRALSRRCHRSLATCQAMHGDAVKARPGREKTVPPRVLTRPFRRGGFHSSHWLFSQCLRAPSPNTAKELSRSTATKVESGILDANRRSLV